MTRLSGEFAILLVVAAPDRADLSRLQALKKSGLFVNLTPLPANAPRGAVRAKTLCLVTVHGADRPGIVYRVTEVLAQNRVNITDLSTHRTTPGKGAPGYILYVEGEAPRALPLPRLQKALAAAARSLGVRVSVKPIDARPL